MHRPEVEVEESVQHRPNTAGQRERAANALKLTASDLIQLKLVDEVILGELGPAALGRKYGLSKREVEVIDRLEASRIILSNVLTTYHRHQAVPLFLKGLNHRRSQ